MVCSLLFCYSMFDLETNINSTCHDHQLSIDNALNLFDVMNLSHVEKLMDKKEKTIALHALGDNDNYTLVIFLDSPKRMAVLEGVQDQPVSYRACYHSRLTTPSWATIGLFYFIMSCVIVILVIVAINTCLKRHSSSSPPQQQGVWARFFSTLKRSNTEPQNDSS